MRGYVIREIRPWFSVLDAAKELITREKNMELAKNIFFFVGSILGIIAFFKPLLDPLLEKNRIRWSQLQEVVKEEHFANVEYQTWDRRYIEDKDLSKIERLIHDIRSRSEYLRFGPILKKYYESELNELVRLHGCFRELVQVPEWEPVGHLEGSKQVPGWCFNKKAFDKGKGYAEDYADGLYVASWYAQRMRNTYRRLSVIADVHLIEIPLTRWVLSKRMTEVELA